MSLGSFITSALNFPFGIPIIPSVMVGSLVLETYTRLPQKIIFGKEPHPLPAIPQDSVFLLFPGYGGPDNNTGKYQSYCRLKSI